MMLQVFFDSCDLRQIAISDILSPLIPDKSATSVENPRNLSLLTQNMPPSHIFSIIFNFNFRSFP